MAAPKRIEELVERFIQNRDAYLSGAYNEAQVRQEFINPMFVELGWDIFNEAGFAEAYKDVVHEDSLRIRGAHRAPDYSFRVGGRRKFFLEAKKPSVNIKGDIHPAFQIRRYAWTAKLPLSILTDFDEFAVYDCRIQPLKTDSASTARIIYFQHTDLVDRWDEIWSIFSKDAVYKGDFDRYIELTKQKRGTSEVDDTFLNVIERWREMLAKNIAINNSLLDELEINYVLGRTIDRIIFLRMCEDRGIEAYGKLQELQHGMGIYDRLKQLYLLADERFNSGLFHFKEEQNIKEPPDDLSLSVSIDDKPLKDIFKHLYPPYSPFEFSVLPPEILGQVYEQFLGKVIRLTKSHRAVVEFKPEVKKAGGVYYTPEYIVEHIVKHNVAKAFEGKSAAAASKLRIVDPACGSGSFLLNAYQFLLNWYIEEYSKNPTKYKKIIYKVSQNEWRLTITERKRILLNNIYGVDIDSQAVEVSKLSLLLKVLEGETGETLQQSLKLYRERVLPDLSENIKCGNSLIGSDFYYAQQLDIINDEERYRINVFDWETEFHEIFSRKNPGFDVVIGNPPYGAELSKVQKKYFKKKYDIASTDTAILFIKHSFELLRNSGKIGLIIPKALCFASNWKKIREYIGDYIISIVDCGRVWTEVKLEQMIFSAEKKRKRSFYISEKVVNKQIKWLGKINKNDVDLFGLFLNGVTNTEINIAKKMITNSIMLNDIAINQRGATLQKSVATEGDLIAIGGAQISQEGIVGTKGKIYSNKVDSNLAYIKENSVLVQNIVAHIEHPIDHIKITSCVPDNKNLIILDTINQLTLNQEYNPHYLSAILNSKLINWYAYRFIFGKAIRTMHFDNPVTSRIPLPESPKDYDDLVELAMEKLRNQKNIQNAKTTQRKEVMRREINTLSLQMDNLVYKLYDLTDEEIAVINENMN